LEFIVSSSKNLEGFRKDLRKDLKKGLKKGSTRKGIEKQI